MAEKSKLLIVDVFSERKALENNAIPDIYEYDNIPNTVKYRIWTVIADLISDFGIQYSSSPTSYYDPRDYDIYKEIKRFIEFLDGKDLLQNFNQCTKDALKLYFDMAPLDNSLNFIELAFNEIIKKKSEGYYKEKINNNIDLINKCFLRDGIGYHLTYEAKILKFENEFIHKELVKPTLILLSNPIFKNAQDEFYKAHEFYKKGNISESMTNSARAFESVMKIICKQKGWRFDETNNASKLIDVIFKNHLIPEYMLNHFNGLRACLESGVPTPRNRDSTHGAGNKEKIEPEEYMASFLLGESANVIRLLATAFEKSK